MKLGCGFDHEHQPPTLNPAQGRGTAHVSHVTCHVSHVTCHVMCHVYFFFLQSSGDSWWRFCYQQGIHRLVLFLCCMKERYINTDQYTHKLERVGPVDNIPSTD